MPSNLEHLDEFKDLFENSNLPPIKGFKAHLHVRPNAQCKLFKPRPVPYALKSKIESELQRLDSLGIISKVSAAEFSTTPIVPVLTPNGQIRICGDFKVTVNRYLNLTQFRRNFRTTLRWSSIFEIRFTWRFSSNGARQRVKAACNHHD